MVDRGDNAALDDELLRRIAAEFLEMPGLQLTPEQARDCGHATPRHANVLRPYSSSGACCDGLAGAA